jgi:TM2 domain-containing membrane protein YozV
MTLPPNDLPPQAIAGYQELTPDQQAVFSAHYNSRKRNTALMVLLAIFFPIQLFLLGKIGLGILFWLTAGGLGVWYVIEWFLTPGRVRDYNARVASDTLNLIKAGKVSATPPSELSNPEVEEE